jgi:hypothetical protein
MSFTDDDKEALGEDLDELKTNLAKLEHRAKGIHKDLRTLVTMAWVYIILSVIVGVVIGVGLSSFSG